MRTFGRPRIVRAAPLRASLAALGAFVLTACIDEPTPLDRRLYAAARRAYNRNFERMQAPLELFGLPGFHIPAALLVARALRRSGHRSAVGITNAALAGWVAVRLSRAFIHRPRPPRPPGRGPKSESTFPSGHTTEITTLAVTTAALLHDERILTTAQACALGIGLPLIMGANRVYVREHWLTDVLGGWALGLSAAMGVLSTRRGATD